MVCDPSAKGLHIKLPAESVKKIKKRLDSFDFISKSGLNG